MIWEFAKLDGSWLLVQSVELNASWALRPSTERVFLFPQDLIGAWSLMVVGQRACSSIRSMEINGLLDRVKGVDVLVDAHSDYRHHSHSSSLL